MKLRRLRKNRGLSIQEVARNLGISRQKYSRIEKNPRRLRDYFLADKIASFYSMPLEELFQCFRERKSPYVLLECLTEGRDVDRTTQASTSEQTSDSKTTSPTSRND